MINVFIGYDSREAVAFHVLAHSIIIRASQPVRIIPIMLTHLSGILTRPRDPLQSTDFAFSRFLTPYLSNYSGWSIFMDCDMVCRDDIAKLYELREDRYAVMVVKHDHVPREDTKFLGQTQTAYERKNWSSVMLFNNARCWVLSAGYINSAPGLDLHQFKWLVSEQFIGTLPSRWNHLVGYDAPVDDIALLHYTQGGPYFVEYRNCDYADVWLREYYDMRRME